MTDEKGASMGRFSRQRLAMCASAAAVAVVAMSAVLWGQTQRSAANPDTAEVLPVAAPSSSSSSDGSTARSEIEDFPGFRRVDYRMDEEQFSREERARENMTAECMRDRGRQYTPVFSVVYGPGEEPPADSGAPENANDKHVATLSEDEKRAYFVDLYGVADPFDPAASTRTTPDSCAGRAFGAIPGVFAAPADLTSAYKALRGSARERARAQGATERWSSCMKQDGWDYSDPQELLAAMDEAEARPGSAAAVSLTAAGNRHQDVCGPGLRRAQQALLLELEQEFVNDHRQALREHRERVASSEATVQRYQKSTG
jgi:hypothetical protein